MEVASLPAVNEGEFLVRNLWLSCDPAQRTWMEHDSYVPKVPLGAVMASAAVGEVVESRHPDFVAGDLVSGVFGWQDYSVSEGGGFQAPMKLPPGVDPPAALSLFGVTGLAAYFGLLEAGRPSAGETVVVSAAAGAVGSVVCQIARLKGCRVTGIAGGTRKCDRLREDLGIDAIDYRGDDVEARLGQLCPAGVDDFFDNVGGEVLYATA